MNRTEFIKFIIDKKSLDKEVFKKSLELNDFPIGRQILLKIAGDNNIEILLNSTNIIIQSYQSYWTF